jgi:2-polyprenyl-3-methyl-5-hydroxy-6-metoxy-1,4-benzoquinol methylase
MGKAALEARISDARYGTETEIQRSSKEMLRAMVPAESPLRILDVGCGTGLNAALMRAAGHSVIGVDLSPVAIGRFREKGLEGFVCDLEAASLPPEVAPFDLVYASEVIEHCADTDAFLKEIHRVLKPGGQLVLSTPNSAFWPYRILGILGRTPSEYQHSRHVRFFSKRSLRAAIESAGFEIVAISGRHMYALVGSRMGDPVASLLRLFHFQKEGRFVTGGHFWQLSRFAKRASGIGADTFLVKACKKLHS